MMTSGIYKIVNTLNKKCYVGSAKNFELRFKRHFNDLRKNTHHNIKLQRSFNKYGESVFTTEILEITPYVKEIIIEKENFWINKLNSKENGYNIADASFGDVLSNHPNKNEIIKKIKNTLSINNNKLTKQQKKDKWGQNGELNGMYGKTHTEEAIEKIKKSRENWKNPHKGIPLSELLGVEKANNIKTAVSKANKNNKYWVGKTHSDESKEKIRLAKLGIKPTEESLEKNRQAQLLRWSKVSQPKITIDGITYDSVKQASEILNVSRKTLRNRAKNPNFSNVIIHTI